MSERPANNLEQLCDAFRLRLKLRLVQAGLAHIVSVSLLLFAGLLLLDWRLHLDTPLRLVTLAAFLFVVGATVWFTLVVPLRRRWDNAEVLAYLDATAPVGQGMLLELYELQTTGTMIPEVDSERGRGLVEAAVRDLQPMLSQVRLGEAFRSRHSDRWLFGAAGLVILLLLASFTVPQYVSVGSERLFNPFVRTRWPHRTTIVVRTPDTGWTVPQFESFTVRADVTGEVPGSVMLAYRSRDGVWVREKLDVQDEKASYTFPEVREPLEFTLEGGDYRTEPQDIAIIQRPYLKSITAHYTAPAYAGIPDRILQSGQVSGLEGTEVRLVLESSLPLEKAVFVLGEEGGEQRSQLSRLTNTTFEKTLMLRGNGRYAVELYDENGYREARPEAYEIRVTPDDPPEVELLAPGKDLLETKQASVEIAFRARDRLGLAKVEMLYQINDGPPQVLSDRVTGPIAQKGTESLARFTWELRRVDLPESCTLRYFVRVQDNNPTGRGKVETPAAQIKLVKPSEFHLEALERAKLLEEEARIAWRNQLRAWRLGEEWLQKGTGAENDPLWADMQETQQKSFQAARQIKLHLQGLTEKHERNHMGQDFMANRLSVVAELLTRLVEKEQAPVVEGLTSARPRSASDAAPDRLKSQRETALGRIKDHQKMAVLVLERMLRKLYDWRDLQTCTVTTKLLQEQQEEVLGRTQEIAPKTIAREIEDLKDADQEKLLTLGKQQRAIFDTESGLENQLTYLMYKAERQGRKNILDPLQAAFSNLRNNRVNHHLKRSAELIENNQPAQIIDNQKAALRALQVVLAGLVVAGQKPEADAQLTLAMKPSEEAQFDPDLIKPAEVVKRDPEKPPETPMVDPGMPPTELPTLPEGTDALSATIRLAVELQDNVLARTRYLEKNRGAEEMPRFVRLKMLRLGERQEAALNGLTEALKEAEKRENVPARQLLTATRDEMTQSAKLIATGEIGSTVQQMQADAMEGLKDLLQFLALTQAVEEAVAENRRLNGVDAFGRKYLLREKDLETALAILADLSHARLLQADVLRKLERFRQHPARGELLTEIESKNRTRAGEIQRQTATLVDGAIARLPQFSAATASRVRTTGLDRLGELKLAGLVERARSAKGDAEPRVALGALANVVQSLRDLLEERVRPEPEVVAKTEPRVTPEEFQKLNSREHIARLLKDEANLPPEVRERMIRALEKEFPPKYRELLQAYYGSFVAPRKEPAK